MRYSYTVLAFAITAVALPTADPRSYSSVASVKYERFSTPDVQPDEEGVAYDNRVSAKIHAEQTSNGGPYSNRKFPFSPVGPDAKEVKNNGEGPYSNRKSPFPPGGPKDEADEEESEEGPYSNRNSRFPQGTFEDVHVKKPGREAYSHRKSPYPPGGPTTDEEEDEGKGAAYDNRVSPKEDEEDS